MRLPSPLLRMLTAGTVTFTTCLPAQNNQFTLLTFPLKADVPNEDQHLTSATAMTNSVFDHSMFNSTTQQYGVYACDDTVVAFTGTTAIYGPGIPIFNVGCDAGYKVLNEQNPPPISLAPDMTYSGWGTPNHLFYDGHPGIDYVAAMDTQVYAAVSGTIHYPTRIVGLGYPAAAYHVMEIVPDHAQGSVPPYLFYYLHLDTYIGQQQMPVNDPDPLLGCAATVCLPLDEGTRGPGGMPGRVVGQDRAAHLPFPAPPALRGGSGGAELHGVHRFGARTADVCIDGDRRLGL